jgi:uncharacterized protein YyaL (SSP411 family)
MRLIKYFIPLALIPLMAFMYLPQEEGLKWESWNEGYPRALKEKKILLVDAYTDWCGWCKKMDRDTYTNPEVLKLLNKYFVTVKFNPEIQNVRYELNGQTFSGAELHMMLSNNQRLGFPTTYFIITTKNRLLIQPGYMKPEDFNQLLLSIVNESLSSN